MSGNILEVFSLSTESNRNALSKLTGRCSPVGRTHGQSLADTHFVPSHIVPSAQVAGHLEPSTPLHILLGVDIVGGAMVVSDTGVTGGGGVNFTKNIEEQSS